MASNSLNATVVRPRAGAPRQDPGKLKAATGSLTALIAIGACATPFATVQLPAIPGYMTAFGAAMIVINVLLAALLFSRGAIELRPDATALGAAYLFVAIIFVPMVASFPGGIVAGSVIGVPASAVWLWLYWHAGFGLAILRYANIATRPPWQTASVTGTILAILAIVVLLTVSATVFLEYLPPTLQNGRTLFAWGGGAAPLATLAILVAATIRIACLGRHSPEQLPLTVAMVAACFDVWLTYCGIDRYSLGWYLSKCGSLFTSLTVLISMLHQINLMYSRVAAANRVLEDLAVRDGLTGLINRRGLDEAIAEEWRKSRRQQKPLSVLMIDVDHFKRFNDRYGHPAGDDCLRRVAGALLSVARRSGDLAARYGGEEFVMLLPATDAPGAAAMADLVQNAVQGLRLPHGESPHGVLSVSIGLASMPWADGDAGALIDAADRGLYLAKAAGRNTSSWADNREDVILAGLLAATSTPLSPADSPLATVDPNLGQHALQCNVLETVAAGQPLHDVVQEVPFPSDTGKGLSQDLEL